MPKKTPPPIREVEVQRVVDEFAGGTQSVCAVAEVEGQLKFLKSQRPHAHVRYANFESEILAHDLFEVAGIKAPEAEVVRLKKGSSLEDRLGRVVLAMDYVDSEFAGRQKVMGGAWGTRQGADTDDYRRMILVDILMGNADRRGANYLDRWTRQGEVKPVPIDNNSGFGNLLNWKVPTNHCNFINSYGGAGSTPGIRQNGTIANILMDTTLHQELLDEPAEQQRTLELAAELVSRLSDEKIDDMVENLPREIIPRGTRVRLDDVRAGLDGEGLNVLSNGVEDGLSGQNLFQFRKDQLRHTLRWRRDHLVEALQQFFAAADPLKQASDDWNLLSQRG